MQYEVIDHGVFTRRFGNSKGNFQSLNVSFGQGDVPEHVRENRRLIARAIAGEALVFAEQVRQVCALILRPLSWPGHARQMPHTSAE